MNNEAKDEWPTGTQPLVLGVINPAAALSTLEIQFAGRIGHMYASGISAQSIGAHAINMQIAAIPPGAWSTAHKHAGHETAIYILSGEAGMWYGEKLEDHLVACAGDFVNSISARGRAKLHRRNHHSSRLCEEFLRPFSPRLNRMHCFARDVLEQ